MRRPTVPAVLGALVCSIALSACSATAAPAPTETPAAASPGAQAVPGADDAAAEACRAELESGAISVVDRLDVEHPLVTSHEGTMRTNGQPFRVVEFPALSDAATSSETPRFCIVARGHAQLISADNTAVWDEWGLPRPS